MEWPEFLKSSNSQEPEFDLFNAAPYDNHEVNVQADRWTPEEKQFFENAFSKFNNPSSQTFFEYVASKLPHKSMGQIRNHYLTLLFKDVQMENPVPKNKVVVVAVNDHDHQHYQLPLDQDDSSNMEVTHIGMPTPQVENTRPHRRRGISWTHEEHELFLMGLNRFGKGDWKNISKYYVISKTRSQVASHAQKFFSRQNCTTPVERRRHSINDIQTITFNPKVPIIVPMGHQINNNLAYENNHQVGSSSLSFRYPYTFGGSNFSNNSNGDFEKFNRGEASGSSSFVMEQNNNSLRRPMSPRPFLPMNPSSATMYNHKL